MKPPSEAQLLRVFIGEADRFEGQPLHEAIVALAREKDMAGATVLRGVMGFGVHSKMHSAKILRISEDLPVVIEIVDKPEKIETFLPLLDEMIEEGLVTLENVKVVAYRGHSSEQGL